MDNVEKFIRAFWRRIYPFRHAFDKELPEEMPVQFRAHCETAMIWLRGSTAIQLIEQERRRQIEQEGWTPEHDDAHSHGELAAAAAMYALSGASHTVEPLPITLDNCWPWSRDWWKPKDQRRDLVRAGALIVAELERLERENQND